MLKSRKNPKRAPAVVEDIKWEPPIGPNNEPISFELLNDMLIFSPAEEGFYKINLSICFLEGTLKYNNIIGITIMVTINNIPIPTAIMIPNS